MSKPSSIPEGLTAVTPWVILDGVPRFLRFLVDVFDAEEVIRMPGPDGVRIVHAEARIAGAAVMLFDSDVTWPATPAFLRVYVDDCDAVVERAVAAGARIVTPPTDLWIGDRAARFADPWDNLWWVHTRMAEPTMEQLGAGPPTTDAAADMENFGTSLASEMRMRGERAHGDAG